MVNTDTEVEEQLTHVRVRFAKDEQICCVSVNEVKDFEKCGKEKLTLEVIDKRMLYCIKNPNTQDYEPAQIEMFVIGIMHDLYQPL